MNRLIALIILLLLVLIVGAGLWLATSNIAPPQEHIEHALPAR